MEKLLKEIIWHKRKHISKLDGVFLAEVERTQVWTGKKIQESITFNKKIFKLMDFNDTLK